MPVLKKLAVCFVWTATLAASGCTIDVQGEESVIREQRRIAVKGNPNVTIRTFDGSVELRSWDRTEILVDIERHAPTDVDAKDIEVRTTEDAGFVTIEALRHHRRRHLVGFGGWGSGSVRLVITVPRELNIEARSGDGTILARDLSGRIQLTTGDGAVRLQHLSGDVTVSTGDGTIIGNDLDGTLSVRTGDGSIDVSGRLDAVNARSGDGPIRVDARSGSAMQREWTVVSGDGSVSIRLPDGFNADIDAHTGDGAITASGVISQTPEEARRGHGVLRGTVGTGGEKLLVRTGDGPIALIAR